MRVSWLLCVISNLTAWEVRMQESIEGIVAITTHNPETTGAVLL